jgi:TATA-box binding protein (TBP) (component of TFIID and TFIIIB)
MDNTMEIDISKSGRRSRRVKLRVRTGAKGMFSRKYNPREKKPEETKDEKKSEERRLMEERKEREHRQRAIAKLVQDSLGTNEVIGKTAGNSKKGQSKKRKQKHGSSLTLCDDEVVPVTVQNVVVRGLMDFVLHPGLKFELGASYEQSVFPAMTYTNHEPQLVVTMQQQTHALDRTVTINITGAESHTHALVALYKLRRVMLHSPEQWFSAEDIRQRKHLQINIRNVYAVNMTCSARIGKTIDLDKFAAAHTRNESDVVYLKHDFPGLTWKPPRSMSTFDDAPGKRVVVIFSTGCLNFLGFKSEQDVLDARALFEYIEDWASSS